MISPRLFALGLALAVAPILQGCNSATAPCVQSQDDSAQKIAALKREKDDTLYEIQLRQDEINQMMASAKGAVGVSNEWLERKSQLTEKITLLQVKAHDLDLQIAALNHGFPGNIEFTPTKP